ncbi:MAG TPA: hypothetical protein VK509_20240, partial [Polyangiales bacterium]|nr:hypothetical protein [Polyangiales bacterium]
MGRPRRLDRARLLWCVPVASTLLACSAQVESDYPGEPLATLRGSVTARASALESVPAVSAGIMWSTIDPTFVGERVEVDGSFPATFTLDLFAPPPSEAEAKTPVDYCVDSETINILASAPDDCSGEVIPAGTAMGFWMGYLVAVDSSAAEGKVARPDVAGADVEHVIVYFDRDDPTQAPLPANPTSAQLAQKLGLLEPDYVGPHDAGYHLARLNPDYQAQRRQWRE